MPRTRSNKKGGGGTASRTAAAGAAGAAAAETPIYVYWTKLSAASAAAQQVYVCPLDGKWSDSVVTEITRSALESQIRDTAAFCEPNVAPDYVERQVPFEKNPVLLVLSRDYITTVPRASRSAAAAAAPAAPRSLGFILARFIDHTSDGRGMYLDVICTAKGLGHKFVQFFHTIAFDNGARYVKLSSLANVLAYYYLKHNYRFRKACAEEPLADLSDALKARDFKTRPAPEETSSAYGDKEFMDFMYDKLYKEADLGTRAAEDCKKRPASLTRVQFKRADCAQDGFTMYKCSRGGARKTRRNHR